MTGLAAILDVETTGFSTHYDEIIELAVSLVEVDLSSGEILSPVDYYCGRREPSTQIAVSGLTGRGLGLTISLVGDGLAFGQGGSTEIHGLTLEDLRGEALDEARVCSILQRAHFIVARNAVFDRGFVLPMFPSIAGKPWLCSMRDVNWTCEGCPGKGLETILEWLSLSTDGLHSAGTDVAAVISMLAHTDRSGAPFFRQLLEQLGARSEQAELTDAGWLQQWRHVHEEIVRKLKQREEESQRACARAELEAQRPHPLRATADFLTQPEPEIVFKHRLFVFTGTFKHGKKNACWEAVSSLGGAVVDNVTLSTDYLVVGSLGDKAWAHGFYGNKIQKARDYYLSGGKIAIVSEDHWAREMERVTKLPTTTSRLRS